MSNELDLINRQGMEVGWDEDMKAKEKDLMSQIEARERKDGIFWKQKAGLNGYRREKETLNSSITW